jgi:hypothetical protein
MAARYSSFWFTVDPGHYVSHSKPSYTLQRNGPDSRLPWTVKCGDEVLTRTAPTYSDAKAVALRHKSEQEAMTNG